MLFFSGHKYAICICTDLENRDFLLRLQSHDSSEKDSRMSAADRPGSIEALSRSDDQLLFYELVR